jgi:rRNA processing protein Krr1/Pno1
MSTPPDEKSPINSFEEGEYNFPSTHREEGTRKSASERNNSEFPHLEIYLDSVYSSVSMDNCSPFAAPTISRNAPSHSTSSVSLLPSSTPTVATSQSHHAWRIISQSSSSLSLEIPQEKLGQLIGSKGQIIQDIQNRTGCQLIVNQNFPPGHPRQVEIIGDSSSTMAALDLVNRVFELGPTAIHVNNLTGGPLIVTTIECSQNQVGRIIGTNGSTIKEIQGQSGARLQINQDFPPDFPRKINISGTSIAVQMALQIVQNLLTSSSSNPGATNNTTNPAHRVASTTSGSSHSTSQLITSEIDQQSLIGQEMREIVEVSKSLIGKVIGKGGETVQYLQRKSGCHFNIDQNVPDGQPCRVELVGLAFNIELGKKLLAEIKLGIHEAAVVRANNMNHLMNINPIMTSASNATPTYYNVAYSTNMQPAPSYPSYVMNHSLSTGGSSSAMSPTIYHTPRPTVISSYSQSTMHPNPAFSYPPMNTQVTYTHPVATLTVPGPPMNHIYAPPLLATSPWIEYKDNAGRSYWYNQLTRVSQVKLTVNIPFRLINCVYYDHVYSGNDPQVFKPLLTLTIVYLSVQMSFIH